MKKLETSIEKYIAICINCIEQSLRLLHYEQKHYPYASHQFDQISIDFMRKYTHTIMVISILIIITVPVVDKTTEAVAIASTCVVVLQFGTLTTILSDNGTEFPNFLFVKLLKLWEVHIYLVHLLPSKYF